VEAFDLLLPSPSTQNDESIHLTSNQSNTGLRDDDGHVDLNAIAGPRNDGPLIPDSLAFPSASLGIADDSAVQPPIPDNVQPELGDLPTTQSQSEQVPPPDPAPPTWETSEPRTNWEGDREEDSQDDDSTDEEDYPFWANLKEDTSAPDQDELRAIESSNETSGLDRE
jgi:hypothetical protein